MDKQTHLFDTFAESEIVPKVEEVHTDPKVHPEEAPRLGGQNAKVLARLEEGPAKNHDLEPLAGRVNSRIADVRRWLRKHHDKDIRSEMIDAATGTYLYTIVDKPGRALKRRK